MIMVRETSAASKRKIDANRRDGRLLTFWGQAEFVCGFINKVNGNASLYNSWQTLIFLTSPLHRISTFPVWHTLSQEAYPVHGVLTYQCVGQLIKLCKTLSLCAPCLVVDSSVCRSLQSRCRGSHFSNGDAIISSARETQAPEPRNLLRGRKKKEEGEGEWRESSLLWLLVGLLNQLAK